MVTEALLPHATGHLRCHFVSNVDGAQITAVLSDLDPETTLFVIASKTFTTQETMTNAEHARRWVTTALGGKAAIADHFVAVSTNETAVVDFGITPERTFRFWDWVGGRYSLWSAIGLPIALSIGSHGFKSLLQGACSADDHFRDAPLEENIPVLMGLLQVWYSSILGAESMAILPYDQRLARLPAYLQQADMESNGKRVDRKGNEVSQATGPVIWGEPGTNGQHAFYQLLHQGTRLIPAEFLACVIPDHDLDESHRILLSNFFAQPEALMAGKTLAEARDELIASGASEAEADRLAPHKTFPGNRPTTSILYRTLDPFTLGQLVALYEHRVFVAGVIWDINSFDQWGVELGKDLAGRILPELSTNSSAGDHDPSTSALIEHFNRLRSD
jgi:glucose-6-phosphate isomerase